MELAVTKESLVIVLVAIVGMSAYLLPYFRWLHYELSVSYF